MPGIRKKEIVKPLVVVKPSVEDTVRMWAKVVTNPDTNIEEIKGVSCAFFRNGHFEECRGCEQPDYKVRECANYFAANILKNPMLQWEDGFDKIRIRDKKKLNEVPELQLTCNTCYICDKCPHFEQNATCAIEWEGTEYEGMKPLDMLLAIQKKRILRAAAFEEMDGGVPDQSLSGEMDRLAGLLLQKADENTTKVKITAEASHRDSSGGSGGGGLELINKLFGGKSTPPQIEQPQQTVDIPSFEIKEPEKVKAKTKKK